MNVLIKISGDLVENDDALTFIHNVAAKGRPHLTIIAGGGTQITEAMKNHKQDTGFRDGVRIHHDPKSRNIAAAVLRQIRMGLANQFSRYVHEDMPVPKVILPYMNIGEQLIHFNADDYLRLLAPNVDEVYCLTVEGRIKYFPSNVHIVFFKNEERKKR